MRYLCLLLCVSVLISCKTLKSDGSAGVVTPPSGLEGPVYDPSTSPAPVSQAPLPVPNAQLPAATPPTPPAGEAAPTAPASYGSVPLDPTMAPKGEVAQPGTAPATYNAPAPAPTTYSAPPPNTAEAALAQAISGMWVNGSDEREMVEFTPDHYSTYYNGQLLFEEPMTYFANCPGSCNGGVPMEISCFTISGPAGTDCYGIVRMTSEVLELSLLGVSTETITYYKQ